MPKSTPGPWRARSCQTAVLVDAVCNGDAVLIALVADNDSQGDTDTERKMNNARLIAAAPQMLEALEAMVKRFQPESHDSAGCMFKNCELCKAIAAIKAAKGEE